MILKAIFYAWSSFPLPVLGGTQILGKSLCDDSFELCVAQIGCRADERVQDVLAVLL